MIKTRQKASNTKESKKKQPGGDQLVAMYLKEIADSTPLSSKEEGDLARRIRAGDEDARNILVEANLRFVVSVAKQYQNRGVGLAELISAGNVGLMTAAERFDETRGFKFISYAVWWIRQSILQTLMEQSTVRMPVNRLDMLSKISRTSEALRQEGRNPSLDVVAATLGFSEQEVEQTLVTGQPVRSLDAPFDDGEERCLMDCLSDKEQVSAEDQMLEFTPPRGYRRRPSGPQRAGGGGSASVLRIGTGPPAHPRPDRDADQAHPRASAPDQGTRPQQAPPSPVLRSAAGIRRELEARNQRESVFATTARE